MAFAPVQIKQYVEQRDKGYWIVGTRISLDSVVSSFLSGESPESIEHDSNSISSRSDLRQAIGTVRSFD
jgi:hypothetical protein